MMLAQGVVLLTDSFDYTNGPLITVSGGTWVHHSPSGSGTGQVDVVNGRVFLDQSEAEDVNALLQGAPYPPGTNLNLYASFTVNFSSLPDGAASSYFAHFKDNTTSGFRARIFTTTNGAPAGRLRLGVGNAGASPTAVISNNLSLGSNYTVVLRYVISNATTTLWLDPASEDSPGVTATDAVPALSISAFALRQPSSINDGVGYGDLYFDNLVVGSAFADVAVVSTNGPSDRPAPGFSLVTYNVKGNGASDWSTNAPQVRAIARELQFLNPDIITFNEIPYDLSYEMTNFVAAFHTTGRKGFR